MNPNNLDSFIQDFQSRFNPVQNENENKQLPICTLSEVKRENIEWLWQNYVPRGKLTVLDGDPGLGKSMLTAYIAACVSSAKKLPGNEDIFSEIVLMLSAEDGVADTLLPRVQAAGGCLYKVKAMGVEQMSLEGKSVYLPDDIQTLTTTIIANKIALVTIDPLMAYLDPNINAHSDKEVRRVMGGLAKMAHDTDAAVIIVRHLNKQDGVNPLYRGGGSIGIIGSARSGLLLAKDPENSEYRILTSTKSNNAKKPRSLRFAIEETSVKAPCLVFKGFCDVEASELLRGKQTDDRSSIEDVKEFLFGCLSEGKLAVKEIQKMARDNGISSSTLNRAKAALGVQSVREGYGQGSKVFWQIPNE